MDTTTLDFNTLALLVAILTLLVAIMGSTITIVSLMFRQSTRHEDSIKALDTKFSAKFDIMGRDVSDVRERLARIEGHMTAPEGFRVRGLHPPAPEEPSPEDPGPDHRQAG